MNFIYLDSCIVIYLVENHPVYANFIQQKIESMKKIHFAISPLVRLEVLTRPCREKNQALIDDFKTFLAIPDSLPMVDEVFDLSLNLRVQFGLKVPDALHLATAQFHDCTAFWTNDNRLKKVSGIALNVLEETVAE
ncbi:MAG: PIN domain-containing protein [Candidatus Riflebacteria bacterium]|nr:PIN domain-containing protein [Candidatus Riflebacteria bacterium]